MRSTITRLLVAALVAAAALGGAVADDAGARPSASAASCSPGLVPVDLYLSEGPPNETDRRVSLRSTGTVRAAVLFVDFPDAPGAGADPGTAVMPAMQAGVRWLAVGSYGRFRVALEPTRRWLRMPRPSTSYGFPGVSYDLHRAYIADVLAVADPVVDLSRADLLYVVPARGAAIPQSPTFRGLPGAVVADGRDLSRVVTFGQDLYTYGRTVVPHETGHLLGLPDLYAFAGDAHRFVGSWDLMGNIFEPTDYLAWHRLKLGWLDPSQFACATAPGTTRTTLTALGSRGGRKAVFVPTGPTTAVLVENRQRAGNDARICKPGLLVTAIDARVPTGTGPVTVAGGTTAGCGSGPRTDATLRAGESVRIAGVTVSARPGRGTSLVAVVTRP